MTLDPGSLLPPPFVLTLPGRPEAFAVASFRAREEVSKLYRLDVHLTTRSSDEGLAAALLGERASLVMSDGGLPLRALHGIVVRAEGHGTFLGDRQGLQLTIVPSLWRLKRRRTRRVFQDQTTEEIAGLLLAEWGITFRFQVHRELPSRGYCVQYDETDHAFLARLLAEEGLFYFFDHPLDPGGAPGEVLVIADAPEDYAPIDGDPALRFERIDPGSGMKPAEDHVTWFVPRSRLRSTRALVRGYDHRRPDAELRDQAGDDSAGPRPTIYEHEGSYEDDLGPRPAVVRLDQARRKQGGAEGTSFCRRLTPGRQFVLSNHDYSSLDGPHVVARVEHEGYGAEAIPPGRAVYQNRFRSAGADVLLRPPRRLQRPRQVAETAIVVGPAGQEIYTDELARIKVQFHWDLDGQDDETSSCWLRVAQAWAGAGWGAQFIPRVGMEVVVTFLGGDLDRPLVTGCVYNATHPPAFPLPENQTRSGFRTWSTPGAVGANELSFEDAAGSEQVFLHAQRNYDELIDGDQTSTVGGARTVRVAGAAGERIGGDVGLAVAGDRAAAIEGDDRLRVGGRLTMEAKGDTRLDVGGSAALTVASTLSIEAQGNHALVVGTPGASAQSDHYVNGSASLGASERIVLNAEQGIVLRCGDTTIEIGPKKLVLRSAVIEISPTESLACSTKDGPSVTLGEDVEILTKKFHLFTDAAALEVDKDVKVKGDKIKLGYDPSKPDAAAADDAPPETKPFTCTLSNYFLKPYAGKKYHLMVEGLRLEGETDGDGVVKQDIPKVATQVVVRLWLDDFPQGRQRLYTLKLTTLPPVASVAGAKERLRNLGYYEGRVDDQVDDALRSATAEFQDDHKDTHALDRTGELDHGTGGALEEVHGG